MKEIRWGILGCGDVAERKSGPAFQQAASSKLVAVMRRDAAKAADFAARHQVPRWYNDADALINDPELDAIYVATPPASHEAYTIAALEAGKAVYLEKPMALDTAGAANIAARAAAAGAPKLAIAHYRRQLPAFLKVQELLQKGSIGKPLFADIRMLQPLLSDIVAAPETNWRVDKAVSGGGLFHDLAPHQLDLMLYFFGPVKHAAGFAANQAAAYAADDMVNGILEFQSGVQFRGLWSFAVPAAAAQDSCEIIGSKGKISFSFFGEEVNLWQEGQQHTFSFKNPPYVQQPMIERVVRYFLDEGPNPCTAEEAVEVMKVIDTFTGKEEQEPFVRKRQNNKAYSFKSLS